jgi:cobalamin biosynthesis protein CbiD
MMNERKIRVVNGQELRCGFTTGSCAAAAASAAAEMLLSREKIEQTEITLPGGEAVMFDIEDAEILDLSAKCSVIKDGGDDPDVTTGLRITAEVSFTGRPQILHEPAGQDWPGVLIAAGEGVGTVTQEGLQCRPGEPAVNPVPRKMITESVEKVKEKNEYAGTLTVVISVPGGAETAKHTFNPRLGITGGISILGTTGIVEPMSEKAIIDTIKITIDKKYMEDTENILISPGNYGISFCRSELGFDIGKAVQISNYVGEALSYIKYKGFKRILFVGHMGKLVKTAAGVMNTHSSYADCRMETIAAHSACCGADTETVKKIMSCLTVDAALDIIAGKSYFEAVKKELMDKVMYHLSCRLKGAAGIEVIMFSGGGKYIVKSAGADSMTERFR